MQRWMVMGMAEYKDISDLKKQIADFKKAVFSTNSDYLTGYICALSATEGIIAELPDVDVVEVVRCKDCKYYMTIHCTCDGCCISDDWYCADGERKDNENP